MDDDDDAREARAAERAAAATAAAAFAFALALSKPCWSWGCWSWGCWWGCSWLPMYIPASTLVFTKSRGRERLLPSFIGWSPSRDPTEDAGAGNGGDFVAAVLATRASIPACSSAEDEDTVPVSWLLPLPENPWLYGIPSFAMPTADVAGCLEPMLPLVLPPLLPPMPPPLASTCLLSSAYVVGGVAVCIFMIDPITDCFAKPRLPLSEIYSDGRRSSTEGKAVVSHDDKYSNLVGSVQAGSFNTPQYRSSALFEVCGLLPFAGNVTLEAGLRNEYRIPYDRSFEIQIP